MTGHSSDPSIDVDKQRPEAARLAERCIAYKGQVEAGAAEIARLADGWSFAKELSEALLKVRPLGGSELFVYRNGQFYADPNYCGAAIEENHKRLHEASFASVRGEKEIARLTAALARAREALEQLVNAKAISGVRRLVSGWNGENQPEPYAERHPHNLGATLPKTTCGAVYELDDAIQAGRAALLSISEPVK